MLTRCLTLPLPFLDSTLNLRLDSLELTLLPPVLRAAGRPQLPQHVLKSQIHGGPEYYREGSPLHAYRLFPSTSGAKGKERLFYHVVSAQIIELSNAKGVALAGWLALVADVDAAIFFNILLSLTLTHSPVDGRSADPRCMSSWSAVLRNDGGLGRGRREEEEPCLPIVL